MPGCRVLASISVLFVDSFCGVGRAQDERSLADVWESNSYPIRVQNGELLGPGAAWLGERSARSQFVLFGEQHGVPGLSRVVAATFRTLRSQGFDFLALEMGPWIGQRFSEDGIEATLQRYPHSLAFDHDEEVELLQTARNATWGLDQSITAIHSFSRLAEVLPNAAARRVARGLYLKSALHAGEYLKHDHSEDLHVLRRRAGEDITAEAKLLISAIESSMEIFVAYRNGKRGLGPKGISSRMREDYMKQQLDERIQQVQGIGIPRVVFKLGGAHVVKGIGPNGVPTLGEHARQIAAANNMDTVHVGIRRYAPTSGIPSDLFPPEGKFVLIDNEVLRDFVASDSGSQVSDDLRADLQGYDALILINESGTAPRSIIAGYESRFERRLISRLCWFGVPLVGLFSALYPFLIGLWERFFRKPNPRPWLPWSYLLAVGVTVVGILVVQVTRLLDTNAVAESSVSTNSYAGWATAVICLTTATLAVEAVVKQRWNGRARSHFVIASTSLVALLLLARWWNLGGMMG